MNWRIASMGLIFSLIETAYFGWNWNPKSGAEVIADGLAMGIVALSMVRI